MKIDKIIGQRERLSEETPLVGDATVRSHGNRNHERLAEMTSPSSRIADLEVTKSGDLVHDFELIGEVQQWVLLK